MNRYKQSMFNYLLEFKDHLILYNTFTKKISASTSISQIRSVLNNPNSTTEVGLLNKLKKDGFIIDSHIQEKSLANMKLYDRIFDRSLGITIMPTEQCNFRCQYCYEKYDKGAISLDLQNGLLKWLRRNVGSYKSLRVSWFGGEPLLALKEMEYLSENMIDICQKRGKPYSAGITTNGYLLTKGVLKSLLKQRVCSIQITLDGPAFVHDKMRPLVGGGGSFDRIINNLRDIRDNVKSRAFKIIIRTNVTNETIANLDEYISFLYKEFSFDSRFLFYFRPVGDWGGERVENVKTSMLDSLNQIYNPLINSQYKLNYLPYIESLNDGMCDAVSRNSFVVGSDGCIYKCTMLFDEEKNTIGMLESNGIISLDEAKISNWVIPENEPENCLDCSLRPSCYSRTCPAKGYILPNNGRCGYENSSIDSILKLLFNSFYDNNNVIINYDLEGVNENAR